MATLRAGGAAPVNGWISETLDGGLTGRALGEGGIARPRRGVLVPLLLRLPGIGGRSRGAGDDMLYHGLNDGDGETLPDMHLTRFRSALSSSWTECRFCQVDGGVECHVVAAVSDRRQTVGDHFCWSVPVTRRVRDIDHGTWISVEVNGSMMSRNGGGGGGGGGSSAAGQSERWIEDGGRVPHRVHKSTWSKRVRQRRSRRGSISRQNGIEQGVVVAEEGRRWG